MPGGRPDTDMAVAIDALRTCSLALIGGGGPYE
jgi:hypothetical protein